MTGLIGAIGADHVLFGSNYPHPEGLREPRDFAGRLAGCDAAVTRQVLRGNTAGLLGLPDHTPVIRTRSGTSKAGPAEAR